MLILLFHHQNLYHDYPSNHWTLICFYALSKSLPVLKEWLCGGDELHLSTLSLLLAVC